MMNEISFVAPIATLRHANARMINRYAPWLDYLLTVTFREGKGRRMPDEGEVRAQIRHLQCTINRHVWHNRTRFNPKCQVLSIPIIEGANTETRIHAHILLGNAGGAEQIHQYMHDYIPRSHYLGLRYDLKSIHDADGAGWYVAKETARLNTDAIAWDIASIPRPLLPK